MTKIAIFYDWLNQWGGAEKVLLDLLKLYPSADLYTLVYDPRKTSWLPKDIPVFTSFINRLPFSQNNPLLYTSLYVPALERFDFSGYDLVISTTSTVGHCLPVPAGTPYVCYYHNLNRHLYFPENKYKILEPLLKIYRIFDRNYAFRPDLSLCNSQTVASRLQHFYHLHPQVIYPGINTDFFTPDFKVKKNNNFLVVSRLVPHKRIDLAIDACGQLGLPLKIVGVGRQQKELKSLAKKYPLINFLGRVDDRQLRYLYRSSRALICPQTEDFGLTALESQACGTPVIAYRDGGLTETVIDGKTGIFFNKPTVTSLKTALIHFPRQQFRPGIIRKQAVKFSSRKFMLNFSQTIKPLWPKPSKTTS